MLLDEQKDLVNVLLYDVYGIYMKKLQILKTFETYHINKRRAQYNWYNPIYVQYNSNKI